ncbi:MAG: UDP-N-acetylmuramate--L-alanine ligase [Planctomycetota bacterium]
MGGILRQDWLPTRVHIVGIGGSATSGLARILASWGVLVTGSDREESVALAALRRAGLAVFAGHRSGQLGSDVELVVHSLAVGPDNPELVEAARLGIERISYPVFLGRLFARSRGVAVAGTHGKTSTTGMLTEILLAAERDPTVLIGGNLTTLQGNWRCGSDAEFLVEACEYQRSFLNLRPQFGVITNVELDHPDVYPDDRAVVAAFQDFVNGFRVDGVLVINGDSALVHGLQMPAHVRVVTFGFGAECEWCARRLGPADPFAFEVRHRGEHWGIVTLNVPGPHSVSNALGALALAVELGLSRESVLAGLARFPGVDRRFQHRGQFRGVELVDDYAHHPTEVRSVITAAREAFPSRRVWAVFQPHQLGRLHAFGSEFATSLAQADRVGLLPAYSVRESAGDFRADLLDQLEQRLRDCAVPVHRFASVDDTAAQLPPLLERGDVCLVIGAGDVCRVTPTLGALLQQSDAFEGR